MVFDGIATYLVDRGFARYLTKEEAKENLREFDEAGLVHQVYNTSRDRLTVVCSCCPCCCTPLRYMTKIGDRHLLTRSAFFPVIDPEQCKGCGTCEERCPMKAIEIIDEKPVRKSERCIGCGLCVTGCPNGVMHLEKGVEVPEPPADASELGQRLLQKRGKLEEFLKVNTPTAQSSPRQ
jgi:ferredoxin